jgi:hypothetical protein
MSREAMDPLLTLTGVRGSMTFNTTRDWPCTYQQSSVSVFTLALERTKEFTRTLRMPRKLVVQSNFTGSNAERRAQAAKLQGRAEPAVRSTLLYIEPAIQKFSHARCLYAVPVPAPGALYTTTFMTDLNISIVVNNT